MLATMMTVSITSSALPTAPETKSLPMTPSSDVLNVELSPGQAEVQSDVSYSVDFGAVRVGMAGYRGFNLVNRGGYPLVIHDISMTGSDFVASGNCPRVIRPRSYCGFQVTFRPWAEGYKNGALYISTNTGLITLYLSGWGTRY